MIIFSEENYPKSIIATRTLHQDTDSFLWSDKLLDMDDCEGIWEPALCCVLRDSYKDDSDNIILVYYELNTDGTTESILDFYVDNLNDLISNNLISVC